MRIVIVTLCVSLFLSCAGYRMVLTTGEYKRQTIEDASLVIIPFKSLDNVPASSAIYEETQKNIRFVNHLQKVFHEALVRSVENKTHFSSVHLMDYTNEILFEDKKYEFTAPFAADNSMISRKKRKVSVPKHNTQFIFDTLNPGFILSAQDISIQLRVTDMLDTGPLPPISSTNPIMPFPLGAKYVAICSLHFYLWDNHKRQIVSFGFVESEGMVSNTTTVDLTTGTTTIPQYDEIVNDITFKIFKHTPFGKKKIMRK